MQSPKESKDDTMDPKPKVRHLRYTPGKVEADATTILKKLFDRVVQECNVHPIRWKRLCDAYIKRQEHDRGSPIENPVEARASINKNFGTMATMTFKNLFKGLIWMRIRRAKITLTLEHSSGVVTEHGVWWEDNGKVTEFDPETDYDPRTPTEVSDIGSFVPASAGASAPPVPPPDLSQYVGRYPETTPASPADVGFEGGSAEPERGSGDF